MAHIVKYKDGEGNEVQVDISKPIKMKKSGKEVVLSSALPLSSADQQFLRKHKADLFSLSDAGTEESQNIIDRVFQYIFKKADPSLEDDDIFASVPMNKRYQLVNIITAADDPDYPF